MARRTTGSAPVASRCHRGREHCRMAAPSCWESSMPVRGDGRDVRERDERRWDVHGPCWRPPRRDRRRSVSTSSPIVGIDRLMARVNDADGACRGGSGDQAETWQQCDIREGLLIDLEGQGQCPSDGEFASCAAISGTPTFSGLCSGIDGTSRVVVGDVACTRPQRPSQRRHPPERASSASGASPARQKRAPFGAMTTGSTRPLFRRNTRNCLASRLTGRQASGAMPC